MLRIRSIDLLRGVDVLLMLFVNEVAGVTGAPSFLRHKGPADDGMTITDLVFPAFLFIVGMAIPMALGARLRRGETPLQVLRHVVARSAALVVVGVLMVNAEHAVAGWLSVPAWNVLMTLGVLLVWAVPRDVFGEPLPLAAGRGRAAAGIRGDRLPRPGDLGLAAAAALLVGDPGHHRLGLPRRRQLVPVGRRAAGRS